MLKRNKVAGRHILQETKSAWIRKWPTGQTGQTGRWRPSEVTGVTMSWMKWPDLLTFGFHSEDVRHFQPASHRPLSRSCHCVAKKKKKKKFFCNSQPWFVHLERKKNKTSLSSSLEVTSHSSSVSLRKIIIIPEWHDIVIVVNKSYRPLTHLLPEGLGQISVIKVINRYFMVVLVQLSSCVIGVVVLLAI